eukprot:s1288_g9.t1
MHALDTDASIDAIRQTAAGEALVPSPLGLFPFGDLLFLGLREFLRPGDLSFPRPGLLLKKENLAKLSKLLPDRGVAARGDRFCGPSWLKRHSSPLLHLPCFQNLHGFFLSFPDLSLDDDLPLSDCGRD